MKRAMRGFGDSKTGVASIGYPKKTARARRDLPIHRVKDGLRVIIDDVVAAFFAYVVFVVVVIVSSC